MDKVIKSKPTLVFVNNDLVYWDSCTGTSALGFDSIYEAECLYWRYQYWDDKDEFVDTYVDFHWKEKSEEAALQEEAEKLWDKYAKECNIIYTDSPQTSFCEVPEDEW